MILLCFLCMTADAISVEEPKVAQSKGAVMYVADVYSGGGLAGLPGGTVKNLRIIAYRSAVNTESSGGIKRILGTVGVEEDGSAMFTAAADMPISIQPLDAKSSALQVMRGSVAGRAGEVVSCTGCHKGPNTAASGKVTIASRKGPGEIKPWRGPARPFSFAFEVQLVLDKYCVSCHDGQKKYRGKPIPNFASKKNHDGNYEEDTAYMSLRPYVRGPGPESDAYMPGPMEYHTSTSELVQMLEKGHHGVSLDAEGWDRLYTWIDLNAPHSGGEYEMAAAAYALRKKVEPVIPKKPKPIKSPLPHVRGWPKSAEDARLAQKSASTKTRRTIDLGKDLKLKMVRIPAGQFVMGSNTGSNDEMPLSKVSIYRDFWLATCEITNAQYKLFDPTYDSGFICEHSTPCYPANMPKQPVIRISWDQAMAFCKWLSEKTGEKFTLPTEAQWEYACRAGSDMPLWYGWRRTDFSDFANLSDATVRKFAVSGVTAKSVKDPGIKAFLPHIENVNDRQLITADVASYKANPWGLYDMHGNVAEWTRTTFKAYPYSKIDGRNDPETAGRKVVRGGSWRDRPKRATSSYRLAYQPYQRVFNVGFRVAAPAE